MHKLHTCLSCKICISVIAVCGLIILIILSKQSGNLDILSGLIPALFLGFIAWNQLEGIQKTSQGDFLLRLHDEFNDRKIQDVMYLIYIIDRRARVKCNSHEERDFHCNSCENVVIEYMKRPLSDIFDSNKEEDIKMRFKISFYLNHLEKLSFFVNARYIPFDDLNNLEGGVIKYHYDLLKDWIDIVRKTDPNAYSELLKLGNRLDADT
jgi:hypothetical protein